MAVPLEDLLKSCTVRVTFNEMTRTGFFVAPGMVMTVASWLSVVLPSTPLLVHWEPPGQPEHTMSADIHTFPRGSFSRPIKGYRDIAILKIPEHEGQPCVGIDPKLPIQNEDIRVFAYPDERSKTASLARYDYNVNGLQGNFPHVVLYLASTDEFSFGIVGAPVWNLRTSGVCGMLVGRPESAMTDAECLAVPWCAASSSFAELLHANRAFHGRDDRWKEASAWRWTIQSRFPDRSALGEIVDPASLTNRKQLGGALGTLLRCRRLQLGKLSEEVRLPLSTVNSYLAGSGLPSAARLREILTVLGIDDEDRLSQWQQAAQAIRKSELSAGQQDNEADLLFRIYIPSERLYSGEAGRLLTLFRDWLITTRGHGVRQSSHRTAAGELYEFFADVSVALSDLREQFGIFSNFMALCADNASAAIDLLAQVGLGHVASSDLVDRFSRDIRRLQVDLRHERERRILSLRHSLEEELLDQGLDLRTVQSIQLNALLEILVPGPSATESLALLAAPHQIQQAFPITMQINQQIINAVESTVIQNVQGTVHLGPEAKQLLALIERFGGREAGMLESAVHELEDVDTRPADRSTAKRQLKKFLGQLAGSVHDVALDLLEKYLESKLGL